MELSEQILTLNDFPGNTTELLGKELRLGYHESTRKLIKVPVIT